ncbi:U1 small nuclear ribonucleoprotein 70 kDa isoform X2 [Dermacentor silvarum]|uniref:U1 small nuclear ribonucleoprotein 70 kDa isoform X2 n=1 Tax=Dermacentor silvarum TaxID=543639 RepID=UPI00210133EE|nr:U1 small nuclear ribonucleoprotein 70 kDa isoform X2 [Dermacentor silvarum]
MTQYLPPNLLALFAPRDPIPYLPPTDKLPHEKTQGTYTGVSKYLNLFEDPKDTPPPTRVETREERIERKRREKAEQVAYKLEQDIALWDPYNNSAGTLDPFKTLFVARINYDTSESKLRREFEVFGPIKKIVIVHNKITGKPRGYAFVEYEHERDMHSAYKHADGKKIDGRRVLVDVERGRTVKGWLPRRLGGGLGGTRRGGPDVNTKHSGREDSRMDERYMDRDGRDREDRMIRGGGVGGGGGVGVGERDRERERRRSRSRDRERRHRSSKDDREQRRERRRDRPDRERPDRERPDRERPERERPERERPDRERPDRERPDRERPERPERDRSERDRGDRDRDRRDRGDRADDGAGGDVPGEREKRRRSRSRERKRKRSRSRSREHRRRRERNGADRGVDGIKQEPSGGGGDQQQQQQDGFAEDSRSAGGPGGNYESSNAEGYNSGPDGGSGYNSESQSSFKMERTEEYN